MRLQLLAVKEGPAFASIGHAKLLENVENAPSTLMAGFSRDISKSASLLRLSPGMSMQNEQLLHPPSHANIFTKPLASAVRFF